MTNIVKATVATIASLAAIRHSGSGYSALFDLPITSVQSGSASAEGLALSEAYPNHFGPASPSASPVTRIHFTLPRESMISLRMYDILGREVTTAAQGMFTSGQHHAVRLRWIVRRNVYISPVCFPVQ